jgi:hypothetical protein
MADPPFAGGFEGPPLLPWSEPPSAGEAISTGVHALRGMTRADINASPNRLKATCDERLEGIRQP